MSMIRVSRRQCCPVCDRPDWCLVAADGSAAICQRVESDHRVGDRGAGWLHRLSDDRKLPPRHSITSHRRERPAIDWDARQSRYVQQLTVDGCKFLASDLGVSVATIRAMGIIGWCSSRSVYTWPMRDADGHVVGIRTRAVEGGKRSDTASDGNGLIYGPDLSADYLLACEGPTDATALVDIGYLSVVAPPSCRLGDSYVVGIIRRLQPLAIVLIPNRDEAGLCGFADLAAAIAKSGCISLSRIDAITPPPGIKDARDWAQKNREHLAGRIAAKIESIKQRSTEAIA